MTTGKIIALTRWTFVGKVMSLLFNVLSSLVRTFLPRSKHLLISWLQSPSAVILRLGYGYILAGMKIARRKTSTTSDMQMTPLMAESEEELKSLLMKVKEESEKVG